MCLYVMCVWVGVVCCVSMYVSVESLPDFVVTPPDVQQDLRTQTFLV